jgi:hypothetical protein
VTEADWLISEDPLAMLEFVRGTATDRKLRLFVVECCRRCWHLLADKPYRHAVNVAEQFAEGLVTADDLARAHAVAYRVAVAGGGGGTPGPLWCAGWFTDPYYGAWDNSGSPAAPAVLAAAASTEDAQAAAVLCVPWAAAFGVENAVQAALLRDVIHAPYRAVHLRAYWRWSNAGTAAMLARAIYEERAFDRLPILADALQDAGCEDEQILEHCRGPGPHIRGCWPVDALLRRS